MSKVSQDRIIGSTEAEPIAHLNTRDISEQDRQDMISGRGLLVGRPVDQIKLRICDDEIQVAGDHVNDGYLGPAHSKENKIKEDVLVWHQTGDAGVLDDQGRLWLLGRIGSAVETTKGPMFPFTVEVASRMWPGVETCALVEYKGDATLCIQGASEHHPFWEASAKELGLSKVIHLASIPMDKRHRSKVDRAKLMQLLKEQHAAA